MIVPPRLGTERLFLEPLGVEHSPGMFLLWSDDQVCRHSGAARDWSGNPIRLPVSGPADSDRIIDFFERAAEAELGLRWAVVRCWDGEFLGAVGFNRLSPAAELAFHLRAAFWGQGFMREAAECALGWLQGYRPQLPVEAFIEPGNQRSIGLARRLGFQATGTSAEGGQRYVLAAGPGRDRHGP